MQTACKTSELFYRLQESMERRGRDSNPRSSFPDTAFPVLHNRPLCHLSVCLILRVSCVLVTPDALRFSQTRQN